VPSSPTSNVEGVAFKQFYQIWLENIVRRHPARLRTLANTPRSIGLQRRFW
jgi:hypothetical protein